MRQLRFLLILVTVVQMQLVSANASERTDASERICEVSSVPLAPPNVLSTILLSPMSFFGAREYSSASFEFANRSTVPLDRIAAIVEYLDGSGQVVVRVPFYATNTIKDLSTSPFPLPGPQHLEKAIGSGERSILDGASPLIPSHCPTRGRVTFEHVWFANGEEQDFSSSVDLDPLPDVLPRFFDSKGCRIPESLDVLVHLRINRLGIPETIKLESAMADKLMCISGELGLWRFTPAIRNGVSIDSDSSLLLRFHASGVMSSDAVVQGYVSKGGVGLTVVHLARVKGTDTHWDILYGSGCCTRTVRSRELYPTKGSSPPLRHHN
jgi:hypothetical protein